MPSAVDACSLEGTFRYRCPDGFVPKLAPFDEGLPSMLIPHLLIFEAPPDQSKQEISRVLQEAVRATAEEIPVLAVDAVPVKGQAEKYHLKPSNLLFTIQDLSADFSFSTMKRTNFCDDLLPLGVFDNADMPKDPMEAVPMSRIKATFIEGGVVLCLTYNHLFGDAQSYNLAARALARSCVAAALRQPSESELTTRAQDRTLLAAQVPQTPKEPMGWSLTAPLPPADGSYENPEPGSSSCKASTQIIRIDPSSLTALKASASPRGDNIKVPWISTHDAVCALLYRSFSRARHACGIIGEDDTLLFSVAIDIRPHLSGLPEDWLGNAIGALRIRIPAREVLAHDGLARLAAAIRASVADINEDKVQTFFAHANQTPGYMLLDNEVGRASSKTGAMLTPWRNLALAKMEWPKEMGHYQVLRFPGNWQPLGWFVIFPDLEDGTWEVSVKMEENLWSHFVQDEDFERFASVAWSR